MVEEVTFQKEYCGFCGNELIGKARFEGHTNCIRTDRALKANELAGQGLVKVRDEREEFIKTHPDFFLGRDGLSYNQRLEQQGQQRRETERQKIIELAQKRRYLKHLESQVENLKKELSELDAETRTRL